MLFENYTSKAELAQKIGMSVGFINKWMNRGLPYYKMGKSVRFKLSEVDAWLKRRQHAQ